MKRIDKINKIITLLQFVCAMLSVGLFLIFVLFEDLTCAMYAGIFVWLHNILFASKMLKNNFLFFVFQLTFFLFLMGHPLVNWLRYQNYGLDFSRDIIGMIFTIYFVALWMCYLGYQFPKLKVGEKREIHNLSNESLRWKSVFYTVSVCLFYISTIFVLIQLSIKIQVVQSVGYFRYYVTNIMIPPAITRVAIMNDYFFFALCAALPSKKKFIFPCMVYILEGLISIGTGQRSTFILNIAFIAIYFVLRNKDDNQWIGKKEKIIVALLVPVLFLFVVTYGYIRIDQQYSSDGILDMIYDLFHEQGVTSTVLGYQLKHTNDPLMQQNFTFGQLWTLLTQNIFAKAIFGTESYAQNTVAAATNGHAMGQSLSYIVLRSEYLAGRGLGSSYLAETMQDFGLVGVAIINLVYGYVMKQIGQLEKYSLPLRLYFCYMIQGLIYAPRDTAIGPFMSFLTFSAIFANVLLVVLTKVISVYTSHKKGGIQRQGEPS